MKNLIKLLSIGIIFLAYSSIADAKLIAVSISGNSTTEAYYDDTLNITWLANWNLARSNQFGLTLSDQTVVSADGLIGADGRMTFNTANQWVAAMNQANYLGANLWRLPTMQDTGLPGCEAALIVGASDCGFNVQTTNATSGEVFSELASVVYDTLANQYQFNSSGFFINNTGFKNADPFSNLLHGDTDRYWIDLVDAKNSDRAWAFTPKSGGQFIVSGSTAYRAVAVLDGNLSALSAVPEPQTLWMMMIGAIFLKFHSKKRIGKLKIS